jgi:hypothetical protein
MTMHPTRLAALLAPVVAAVAAPLLAAPPAAAYDLHGYDTAADGSDRMIAACRAGYFCVSKGTQSIGEWWGWFNSDRDWWLNDGGSAGPNNKDDSWLNNGVSTSYNYVVVYKYGNGGSGSPSSPVLCVRRGDYTDSFYVPPSVPNQGSAHVFSATCPGGTVVS